MADENTTDSQTSTTEQQDQSQADSQATDSSTSTTEEKTILGDAKDGDKSEDKADDKGGEDDKSDDKATDAAADKSEDKAEASEFHGAPEGDYTITGLPEGMAVDKEALDALTPVAKELNLSDAGMSKLAGVYAGKILPHLNTVAAKEIEAQAATQRADWHKETAAAIADDAKLDPDKRTYDGKPLAEVQQVAARALDRLGSPELREFLEVSGLGNHPDLVRFAYRAGRAIKEDGFERDGQGGKGDVSREEKFYGKRENA